MMNKIILFIFLFLFFNCFAEAYPATTYFGTNPDPHFIKLYYERLSRFQDSLYPHKNFNWSPFELQYIDECKKSWTTLGFSESKLQLFEYFSMRQQVENKAITASTVFIAPEIKSTLLFRLIEQISKKYDMAMSPLEKNTFFGFEWSQKKPYFSSFHLINSQDQLPPNSALRKVFLDHSQKLWLKNRLYEKRKFKNGKIQYFLYIPLKEIVPGTTPIVPLDMISAVKIISDAHQVEWHYRLKSLAPFLIDTSIHSLIDKYHREFNLYPHSIIYKDEKNFTLYYP